MSSSEFVTARQTHGVCSVAALLLALTEIRLRHWTRDEIQRVALFFCDCTFSCNFRGLHSSDPVVQGINRPIKCKSVEKGAKVLYKKFVTFHVPRVKLCVILAQPDDPSVFNVFSCFFLMRVLIGSGLQQVFEIEIVAGLPVNECEAVTEFGRTTARVVTRINPGKSIHGACKAMFKRERLTLSSDPSNVVPPHPHTGCDASISRSLVEREFSQQLQTALVRACQQRLNVLLDPIVGNVARFRRRIQFLFVCTLRACDDLVEHRFKQERHALDEVVVCAYRDDESPSE